MAGTTSTTTSSPPPNKKKGNHHKKNKNDLRPKPKITKEERRAKYTQLARDREARKRRKLATSNVVCFQCRQKGHGIADCPQNNTQSKAEKQKNNPAVSNTMTMTKTRVCYKCGSTEHPLSKCPKRNEGGEDYLPFCHCFICNEKGHLSAKCPKNDHGIFVHGGECKQCGSKLHTSKDCPDKEDSRKASSKKEKASIGEEIDPDTLLEGEGDDLVGAVEKNSSSEQQKMKKEGDNGNGNQKQKKKPRVVNF